MYPIRIVSLSAANARVPENAAPAAIAAAVLRKWRLLTGAKFAVFAVESSWSRNIDPPP
jgi:hypothetical protein